MDQIIGELIGKKVDVNCGSGTVFRGENSGQSNGILTLTDEDGRRFYIDMSKIISISEVGETASKPGFIG